MVAALLALALAVDALPPPSVAPLTIAEAVAIARRESPVRASVAALAEGADLSAGMAARPLNPLVDVRVENLSAGAPISPARDVFAIVSQPIELAGKRGVRRQIAEAERDASAVALRTIERQIALDTVRAYMRAVRARDVLETLAAQRAGVETLVDTMRRRVGEGYAPESDLLRFQAEAARTAAEVARTEIELTRALLDLTSVMGSRTPIVAAQLVRPAPVATVPLASDAALERSVTARADVQLAAARTVQAQRAVDFERLRRIPDPAVTAGYKRTQGQNTAVAGVVLAIPLFDRNAQARAMAEANLRSAAFDEAAVRTRALTEARAAQAAAAALAESAARVERELLAPAEGVRDAARALFREGVADVLKLVDAERIYADVRREAQSLAADAYVAAVEARFAAAQEEIP